MSDLKDGIEEEYQAADTELQTQITSNDTDISTL